MFILIVLVVSLKSGKLHVIVLPLRAVCHCYYMILHHTVTKEGQDTGSHVVLSSARIDSVHV